ncbi:MAG: flagellar biosynthesis anti-sigma factor FlgM [Bacillota bacterium]|nr:flagellar biosynthesis anti-sigma factor FlgM [Bacillota bacterium]
MIREVVQVRISSQQLERLLREYQAQQARMAGQAAANRAGTTQEAGASSASAAPGSAPAGAGGRDTVEFSPAAQELLRTRATSTDPARAAQIDSIRRRLQAGTYQVPGEDVARAWLRRLVADRLAQRLGPPSQGAGSSGGGVGSSPGPQS